MTFFSVSQGNAISTDITVQDGNNVNSSPWNGTDSRGPAVIEDQETESPALSGQVWDLETFALNTDSGQKLYIIGGYDFSNGQNAGSTLYTPGDLFINRTSDFISEFEPTANTGTILNGDYHNYDWALDLSEGGWSDGESANVGVWELDANTVLETVSNDFLESNPWRVQEPLAHAFNTTVTYHANKTAAEVALLTGGVGGSLLGENGNGLGSEHYVLEIDLGFVHAPLGATTTLHYTMECGNDSLKGEVTGGFHVPDGGMTLSLFGLGLAGLALMGRARK